MMRLLTDRNSFLNGILRYLALQLCLVCLIFTVLLFSSNQQLQAQHNSRISSGNCDHCGLALPDKFVEYNGGVYHLSCYENEVAAKCEQCGEILNGPHIIFQGEQFHEQCYLENVAVRCSHCSDVIEGAYQRDFWGNSYHSYHDNEADKCEYCGRLISGRLTGGGFTYSDGRTICGLCEVEVIDDAGRARRILDEVAQYLKLDGITVDPFAIELVLADRDELLEMSTVVGHDLMGFTRYKYRKVGDRRIDERFKIHLLDGMPRSHVVTAAAHELMHVWQFKHARSADNDQLCEGSSNYAAFLITRRFAGSEYDYIRTSLIKSKDIIYGSGFRRVKRLVDSEGIRYWLESLLDSSEFPDGY